MTLRAVSRLLCGALVASAVLLSGCASAPATPFGLDDARARLLQVMRDPSLSEQTRTAIAEAEAAIAAAQEQRRDEATARHLVYVANQKVEIARELARADSLQQRRARLERELEVAVDQARERERDVRILRMPDTPDAQDAQDAADDPEDLDFWER